MELSPYQFPEEIKLLGLMLWCCALSGRGVGSVTRVLRGGSAAVAGGSKAAGSCTLIMQLWKTVLRPIKVFLKTIFDGAPPFVFTGELCF